MPGSWVGGVEVELGGWEMTRPEGSLGIMPWWVLKGMSRSSMPGIGSDL